MLDSVMYELWDTPTDARTSIGARGEIQMKKLLAAVALSGCSSLASAETQTVTVILSDASTMTQGMAMVLAN